jgi:hypothetical protein
MRKLFTGYYRPTREEFDRLWQECIFTFDANVLLNIYRYSSRTLTSFLMILDQLKDRIWLSHQAAYEYQKNRLEVISSQLDAYDGITKLLNGFLSTFKTEFPRHPFIDIENISKSLENAIKESARILKEARESHTNLVETDNLREKISDLFESNIGIPYSDKELGEIYKEADKRYQQKTPPGFKDANKPIPEKYGDVVLWFQLKNYAKVKSKSIILITDDTKEDWWLEHQGKTISPRPELIQEMAIETEMQFYMYQSDQFIKYAQQFLGLAEDKEAVEEAKEIREEEVQIDESVFYNKFRPIERLQLYQYQQEQSRERHFSSMENSINATRAVFKWLKENSPESEIIITKSDFPDIIMRNLEGLTTGIEVLFRRQLSVSDIIKVVDKWMLGGENIFRTNTLLIFVVTDNVDQFDLFTVRITTTHFDFYGDIKINTGLLSEKGVLIDVRQAFSY